MKYKDLAQHLPETHKMKKSALWRLVDKYGEVILKPTKKKGGEGVIQLTSAGSSQYEVHLGRSLKRIDGKEAAYLYIKPKMTGKYMIQRKIPLATINGRPFDLRVMVQRKKDFPWEITGKLAKVAGEGFFITNMLRSKGRILTVETAIQRSALNRLDTSRILAGIDSIALKIAQRLGKSYPQFRSIGLDLGIDERGKIWFIEANFAPMLSLFRKLKDKSAFKRMISYKKG